MPRPDHRSPARVARDAAIAAEPLLPIPDPAAAAAGRPMEAFLPRNQPAAAAVENGPVRPIDAAVLLTEPS